MIKEARLEKIIEELIKNNFVVCNDLASKFGTCISTIRNDLDILKKEGIIKRTHGGAILINNKPIPKTSFYLSKQQKDLKLEVKEAIGKVAASLIKEGDTIMIDGGTTTPFVFRNLTHLQSITIVSSSSVLANELNILENANIFLTGGFLNHQTLTFVGEDAENMIRNHRADKAVLGIDGISLTQGLTANSNLESKVKKQMISSSSGLIIVADSSKLGKTCTVPVAELEKMNYLVTDSNASKDFINKLKKFDIKVIIA